MDCLNMEKAEVFRAHNYGPQWDICAFCGVQQPGDRLEYRQEHGKHYCKDQEICKRWFSQRLKKEEGV